MRIALFSPRLDVTDGYGNITYEYCTALARKPGIECTLFLPASERENVRKNPLPIPVRFSLAPYVIAVNPLTVLPYLLPVNVRKFDVVHSLFDFPHCFQAAWSACLWRKPFVMGVQGTYGITPLLHRLDGWLLRRAYRRATAITVPSRFTGDLITATAGEHYPLRIIHNGVNIERFRRPADASAVRSQFPGKRILLTVGGLKLRKGQDLVIRAMRLLRDRGRTDLVYLMVGEGPQRKDFEALVAEQGVTDCVVFAGSKTGDTLLEYFDAADIYVHTPRVFHLNFEGFGIVYLEAGARGKPVVAADAGGIRDAVIDGETGIITPEEDVPAIADAIERLLNDPALAKRMGEAGRMYAEKHDWSTIVDQFLPLYEEALQSK